MNLLSFLLSVPLSEETQGNPSEEEIRQKIESIIQKKKVKSPEAKNKAARPLLEKMLEVMDRYHIGVVTADALFTLMGAGFDDRQYMYSESLAVYEEQLKLYSDSLREDRPERPRPYFPESARFSEKLLLDHPDFPRIDDVVHLILYAYMKYGNGSAAEFFENIWPVEDPAWIFDEVMGLETVGVNKEKKQLIEYCRADFCYQTGRKRKARKIIEKLLEDCGNATDSRSDYCTMAEEYLKEKFQKQRE